MIPLFGIGVLPAGIALTLYALLPVLQNTYVGISEVDPALNRVRIWNGNDKMAGASDGCLSTSGGGRTFLSWPVFEWWPYKPLAVQRLQPILRLAGWEIFSKGIAMIDTVTILEGAVPICYSY